MAGHDEGLDLNETFLILAVMTLGLLVCYYGFTIAFVVILIPVVGYRQIRRLGYSPGKASTLVLGVAVVAIITTASTIQFVPQAKGFWGDLSNTLFWVGMFVLLAGAGCRILVRKLPKREVRVSGPRRVWFPFVPFGYLVIAGGCAGGIAVMVFAPPGSATVANVMGLLVAVMTVAVGGKALITTGNRVAKQISIEDATSFDPRPPVFFLRPFFAERVAFVRGLSSEYGQYGTETQGLLTSMRSVSDSDGNKREEDPTISILFEDYLGSTFRERIGPFVALGNPEDYLPPEGAVRTYAADEGWYEYFERLARKAVCMVMPAANSTNLQRELTFLRRESLQQRLFIITPLWYPTDVKAIFQARAATWLVSRLYGIGTEPTSVASWKTLAASFQTFGFDLGDDPGRGAVVTFDSECRAICLVSGAKTPSDFIEPLGEHLARMVPLDRSDAAGADD